MVYLHHVAFILFSVTVIPGVAGFLWRGASLPASGRGSTTKVSTIVPSLVPHKAFFSRYDTILHANTLSATREKKQGKNQSVATANSSSPGANKPEAPLIVPKKAHFWPFEHEEVVLHGSSVACFLTGSMLGLIGVVWDAAREGSTSMLADFSNPLSSAASGDTFAYQAILILSPVFYLLEAVLEISKAERIRAGSILFGSGAICELLAAVLGQTQLDCDPQIHIISLISAHSYLLNVAVLLLMDRRRQGMVHYGNVIFAVGASIDVSLSYGFNWNHLWMEYGSLLSASCWLLDALVYAVAYKLQDNAIDSSVDVVVPDHGLRTPPVSLHVVKQTSGEKPSESSTRQKRMGSEQRIVVANRPYLVAAMTTEQHETRRRWS